MIIAIIVLSVLVFLLCAALFLCAFKLFDLNAQAELALTLLRDKEEICCRMQNLAMDKFKYFLPQSDMLLRIEERAATNQKGAEL